MSSYALAETVAVARPAVSESMRRMLIGPGSPLVAAAVADAFLGRVATMTGDDARLELLAWVGGICSSYGDVAALRETLLALPEALARAAAGVSGRAVADAEIAELAQDVREMVDATWRPLVPAIAEPLDEIDARIDAMITPMEARDPMTLEHSRAVAAWCARLGRRLGLVPSDVTFVTRCGLLHDVGKASTPLEVLNAPRALDDREWKIMRSHAAAGEAMVRKIPELRAFAPAVRSHHERLDGRGYPDGLPAAAIPLTARIVAVADCFNAMIGRRPYRLPMPPTRALEELERNRGTQFDPEIVDAMVSVVLG